MKKLFYIFSLIVPLMVALNACDDLPGDDQSLAMIVPEVHVILPDTVRDGRVVSERYEVRNVTTGRKAIYLSKDDIDLSVGLYDVSYETEMQITTPDGGFDTLHLQAYEPSVLIRETNRTITLTAYVTRNADDFIISEIFFTGSLRPNGSQYYGDDYVKIFNNTDHVLYADGLTFLESKFVTTQKYNYTPDIMSQAMTVQALYTIPGSGKDYPVQPGEELWIVDTGIDHRVANENSFDCSGADFEWYDVSTQPAHLDIDGPVTNLDKWYCYTLSFFVLHNRGFRAWALARIPIEKEQYLANYSYTYNYIIIVPAGVYPMSQTAYKVPNDWIVDAVNCSVEAERVWNVTDPSLDRGWTYCGTMDHDKTRYFHSVRRKMLYLKNGRPVLKDTNNSTEDFNPHCIPSEIENQGTAIDVNGTPCTQRTWDGVTPR